MEDAAQAHGAKINGKRIGGFGEMNKKFAKHLRSLKNHGSREEKYYYDEIGYNMRMGGIEAVVLDVKLKYLDQWNN